MDETTIVDLTLFGTTEKVPVVIDELKQVHRQPNGSLLIFEKTKIHVVEDMETIIEVADLTLL